MTDVLSREAVVEGVVEAALQEPCGIGVVQTVVDSDLTVREQLDVINEVANSPDGELSSDEARLIKREFVIMAVEERARLKRARKYSAYLGPRAVRSIIK